MDAKAVSTEVLVTYDCPETGSRVEGMRASGHDVWAGESSRPSREQVVFVDVACPSCGRSHDIEVD